MSPFLAATTRPPPANTGAERIADARIVGPTSARRSPRLQRTPSHRGSQRRRRRPSRRAWPRTSCRALNDQFTVPSDRLRASRGCCRRRRRRRVGRRRRRGRRCRSWRRRTPRLLLAGALVELVRGAVERRDVRSVAVDRGRGPDLALGLELPDAFGRRRPSRPQTRLSLLPEVDRVAIDGDAADDLGAGVADPARVAGLACRARR